MSWLRFCALPLFSSFVLPDTSRKSRQKTRVLRRTVDPVFNHTMVYDGIRDVDLAEACVELTVWDRDRLASNLLGGLRLGVGTGELIASFLCVLTCYKCSSWHFLFLFFEFFISFYLINLGWILHTQTMGGNIIQLT